MYGDLNCDYVKEGSLEREDLMGGVGAEDLIFEKEKEKKQEKQKDR